MSLPRMGKLVGAKAGTKVLGFALAAAAATLSLGACTSDATENDQTITVYSGRSEELVQPLIDQFEKDSGITVDVRYGDTAAMAAQILEEGEKTKADVFLAQDAGALGAVAKDGLFAELPGNIADSVPAPYVGADKRWVGVTGRARVVVYNPDKVSENELPLSIFELTDPKWKGRVAIAPTNGSFQAFVTAIRVSHDDATAEKWLADMKANDVQLREKNGIILDDVNNGTVDLGLINHYYWYEKEAEVGTDAMNAKLHFIGNGDPGALVNISGVGILDHAKDDADVREFVEYLLSSDGQEYFAEKTHEYPLASGVKPADTLPALEDLDPPTINLDDLDSLEVTIRLISDSGLTTQ